MDFIVLATTQGGAVQSLSDEEARVSLVTIWQRWDVTSSHMSLEPVLRGPLFAPRFSAVQRGLLQGVLTLPFEPEAKAAWGAPDLA